MATLRRFGRFARLVYNDYDRGRRPIIMTKRSQLGASALGVLMVSLTFGCATAPVELDLPPQTLTEGPSDVAALGADPPIPRSAGADGLPPAEAPPPVEDEVAARTLTVVIKSAESTDGTPQSLFEASQAERARRASSGTATVRLTNENLAEHAEGGQLTIASPRPSTDTADVATEVPEQSEEYWRTRALDLRLRWKETVERVGDLESEVSLLRRRFYDEDDPFYRDNEIKPAWDRAIEELAEVRRAVGDRQGALDDFLEAGHRAGALPGWLNQGIDLEPERQLKQDDQAERRRGVDPREPKILYEDEIRR